MSAERDAWIALASVDGVGPATFARLLAAFESPGAVLDAARRGTLAARLRAAEATTRGDALPPLPPELVAAAGEAARRVEQHAALVRRLGLEVVTWQDETYPPRLRGLDDAPPVIFVRGSVAALSAARSVAVVGTRRPTTAGRSFSGAIGAAIASCRAAVVSGLAFGIDAAAHAGAVEAGGVTVAVIGSGQAVLTPAAHRHLAASIVRSGGAVISELRCDARPTKGTYPRRNRLIAGLADTVVVVEAPARSGALNTAHWAALLGRELFVVPGRPWERVSAGCLRLLHDVPDCQPVVDVPTLLEDLGFFEDSSGPPDARPRLDAVVVELAPIEAALARQLRQAPATPDRLASLCGLPIEEVASGLSLLELRGYAWSSGALYFADGPLRDAR